MQVAVAMYLVRANTSCQQELEVKTKVWIVSNPPDLRSVLVTGIWFHTALQLHVVVGVQLMCLPYHMLKAIVPDGLQRNVEISAQALCSTMGSSQGLISTVLDTLLPSWEGDRVVSMHVIPLLAFCPQGMDIALSVEQLS